MTDFLDAMRPHYDVPADKPCLKRIEHENVSRFETVITWCLLEQDHDGQCSGPLPSILDPEDLDTGPLAARRRRF